MFQPTTFPKELLSAVENHESVHLVSKNPNFPALDSVVHDPRHDITDIQNTTRKDLPVPVIGLKQVQRPACYSLTLHSAQALAIHIYSARNRLK